MSNKPSLLHNSLLVILLISSFLFISYVSQVVFHDHVYCQDEHAYLLQARIFATGKAYIPFDEDLMPVKDLQMIVNDRKLFAKYPPGYPLVLSLGVLAGWPGLINPLLSVLTLFFIYRIIVLFAEPLIAFVITFLLAFNSYFIGYGASFYSQPIMLTISTIAFYLYLRYELLKRSETVLILGSLIGFGFLVRQTDAVCLFLTMSIFVSFQAIRSRRYWDILLFLLGPIMGVVTFVLYTSILTGHVGISLYPLSKETGIELDKGYMQGMLIIFKGFLDRFYKYFDVNFYNDFLPRVSLLFVLLTTMGALQQKIRSKYLYIVFILILILTYNLSKFSNAQFSLYGVRYWYPILSAVAILAAMGLLYFKENFPKYIWISLVGICLTFNLININRDLKEYSYRFKVVDAVYKDIHDKCKENSIIVLQRPATRLNFPAFMSFTEFHKNYIPNEHRFYVYSQYDAAQVKKSFPLYDICQYNFSAEVINSVKK